MRIAMISTPSIPVPPPAYGGTELIVAELAAGLTALGHEVIVYTVGDPEPPARAFLRQPVWPPDPYHELLHVARAMDDVLAFAEPFDVIHTHCPTTLALAPFVDTPMVYTVHHQRRDELTSYYRLAGSVQLVAISRRQRELLPELRGRCEVVLHGLDPSRYPPSRRSPGEAALFLGRLSREKGPHLAIDVARRAGVPLLIAGRPHAGDEDFFRDEVEPRIAAAPASAPVSWLGEVAYRQKLPLLQHARATLFTVDWEEPFGLVMIESMLCGTPVLALPRGSVPEVIDEGVTGFVCEGVDEMEARLRWLAKGRFDRRRCHEHAVRRFSRQRMVDDYLRVYARAIAARGAAAEPSQGAPTGDPRDPAAAGA